MKKLLWLIAGLALAGCAAKPELAVPPAIAPAPLGVQSRWIQLGTGGAAEVRAVVEAPGGACPSFRLAGGGDLSLTPRAAADGSFALMCSAPFARGASVVGLPTVNLHPQRIVVLGDTGCRLKDRTIQNCNNPRDWPFPSVAAAAARLKPDLVIHMGDYEYRESPCPAGNRGCAGTPYGDNWATWKADFFAPAAPLMAAAPWIFVRGNHETCDRSGPGYLRLIGPLSFAANCVASGALSRAAGRFRADGDGRCRCR